MNLRCRLGWNLVSVLSFCVFNSLLLWVWFTSHTTSVRKLMKNLTE
jgi:hypothetical protein